MNTGALLSLGQLCGAHCEVYMNKNKCDIHYKTKLILRGKQDHKTGMWLITNYDTMMQPHIMPQISSAYEYRTK